MLWRWRWWRRWREGDIEGGELRVTIHAVQKERQARVVTIMRREADCVAVMSGVGREGVWGGRVGQRVEQEERRDRHLHFHLTT